MSNSSIWGFSTGTSNSNIPKTTQAIANQPKSNTQTTQPKPTKPSTTQTVTKTNTQVSKPSTTQKVSSLPVNSSLRPKATVDTQALKKELADYKIKLRNLIGRKIDFANVVGDGYCAISFKVASNGKLVNRAFAKQSSNITLNDAVYKAVMATPSYNPPPSGYNNETMVLKIRFYNGNFDISLN
jgi:outer membrane biosynthesis protein TonB